jgi:carbonic anhydrase
VNQFPPKEHVRNGDARFNRSSAEKSPLRAMFILCSEDYFGGRLIARCDASIVLQTPGGAAAASESQARATIEYAVLQERVRQVVVLAHRGCRFCGAPPEEAREQALVQWQSLANDAFIHSLFRDHSVHVRLLWVDATSGEVCAFRADQQRLEPMWRGDFDRMLESLEESSS